MDEGELAGRIHTAYWTSARGVNGIADDFGISKGRLYELLTPLDVGAHCPACAGALQYPHRTARERETPTCPDCSWTGPLTEAGADVQAAMPTPRPDTPRPVAPRTDTPRTAPEIPRPFKRSTVRTVTIVLATAFGAAAGYYVGRAVQSASDAPSTKPRTP
jgi:hypothetical protein